MAFEMKPNHLLANEVTYELRVRGVSTTRDIHDKRKMLGRLLAKERGRDVVYQDPEFNYESEKTAITETLENIKTLVQEFEGPATDSMFVRLNSRLVHISGRVRRMVVDANNAEAISFKNEAYATGVSLEADLYERVTNDQPSPPTGEIAQAAPVTIIESRNKHVDIFKWGLKFDGSSKSYGIKAFLERAEELCESRGVGKEELFKSAADLFEDKALIWYRSARHLAHDWDSLVRLLKLAFLPGDYDDRLWEEIKGRKQGKSESVTIYVAVMESLFSRLSNPPALVTRIKYIRKNLLPEYGRQLALLEFNSVEDLWRSCQKLEENLGILEKGRAPSRSLLEPDLAYVDSQPSTSSSSTCSCNRREACSDQRSGRMPECESNNYTRRRRFGGDRRSHPAGEHVSAVRSDRSTSKIGSRPVPALLNKERPDVGGKSSSINCYNCGLPNHTFRHCMQKRSRFCFRCGRQNVTVKECDGCSGNGRGK